MIELGSIVTDTATGLSGMVTHLQIEMSGAQWLLFQPRGLNPKSLQPVDSIWLIEQRLTGGKRIAMPDLPTHVLGTQVEDEASGFAGMAVALQLHINGCVHVDVQPKGVQDTGAPIKACNFDIRRLKGKAIKPLTKAQLKTSTRAHPSPAPASSYSPSCA